MPDAPSPSNADLSELLLAAAAEQEGHRARALNRAGRDARFWPEEAAAVLASGRPLTELRSVGPWVGEQLTGWIEEPPPAVDIPPERAGFLTFAEVRAILDGAGEPWTSSAVADLQVHSTDSDGASPIEEMAAAARDLGRTCIAHTDHSVGLKIAHGQTDEELRDQGRRIEALNAVFAGRGDAFRSLRAIELDVFPDGSSDAMDPALLHQLDLVLGAFHSSLRVKEDQTERYLAALRNPDVLILAHPSARMFGRRVGLSADWPRVFAEAARLGKAVEIDATPARQDLRLEHVRLAVAAGVTTFSLGSDAHTTGELGFLPFGMAIAAAAGVRPETVLNLRAPDEVIAWGRELRER